MTQEEIVAISRKLGRAQKRVILSLSADFGRAADHQAAKRLWWRDDIPLLLDHRHQTGNCWQLRPLGLRVRAILEKEPNHE
mgnify:CR=1 FL=1